jgi:hypothetical protein
MMMKEPESFRNVTIDGGPWDDYTENARLEDVERCCITLDVLDLGMRSKITSALRYKSKFLGRGLIRRLQFGATSLIVGDRLEPTPWMRDVAHFEFLVPPFQVRFWRCFEEDRVLHDSPLFLVPGLDITTQGPDTLHGWALGPVVAFIPFALWFLVQSSLYTPGIAHLSTEDCAKIALLRIRAKLWAFYKIKRGEGHWKTKGSQVWNLTLGMLGKRRTMEIQRFL